MLQQTSRLLGRAPARGFAALSAAVPAFATSPVDHDIRRPTEFDPDEHLCLSGPSKVHSLGAFGLDAKALNVADFGSTEPFRLFTPACVDMLQTERIRFQDATTFRNPPFAPCVQRGLTHYSSFIDNLWSSPHLSNLLSSIVGIPIEPHGMALERAHVNVQEKKMDDELAKGGDDEAKPVFGWHTDSQPFVCITMLSDVPEDARGGETYVQKADGEVLKLQFPAAGYSYVLQGSVLPHAAMPALNYERVTMITSFVPSSPLYGENTDLALAVNYSNTEQLKDEFQRYRSEYLRKRVSALKLLNLDGGGGYEKMLDEILKDVEHTRNSLKVFSQVFEEKSK